MVIFTDDPWKEVNEGKLTIERWNCECDKSEFPRDYVGKCLICREKPDLGVMYENPYPS